jgi:hypothetical protein
MATLADSGPLENPLRIAAQSGEILVGDDFVGNGMADSGKAEAGGPTEP